MILWDSRVVTNGKQRCSCPVTLQPNLHASREKFPARITKMFLAMLSAAAKSNKLERAKISNIGRMDLKNGNRQPGVVGAHL